MSGVNQPPWRPQVSPMETLSPLLHVSSSISKATERTLKIPCAPTNIPQSVPSSITSRHVMDTLHVVTRKLSFQKLGFYTYEIGSHSLRLGRPMTIYLASIPKHTIKFIGGWQSDAFLVYLYIQITTFTQCVTEAMAKVRWFKYATSTDFS